MSGNNFLNKNVLRRRWKVDIDVAEVTSSGSWFHVWGLETENARLPIVDSLTAGTVRRLVTAERKARRGLALYIVTVDVDRAYGSKVRRYAEDNNRIELYAAGKSEAELTSKKTGLEVLYYWS